QHAFRASRRTPRTPRFRSRLWPPMNTPPAEIPTGRWHKRQTGIQHPSPREEKGQDAMPVQARGVPDPLFATLESPAGTRCQTDPTRNTLITAPAEARESRLAALLRLRALVATSVNPTGRAPEERQ